ncbi:MAG: hypothetical protein AB7G37_18195, partial [Solirubrobacteraceae bacterium]
HLGPDAIGPPDDGESFLVGPPRDGGPSLVDPPAGGSRTAVALPITRVRPGAEETSDDRS